MRPSIRFGKIAGIEVGVHYSLVILMVLVSWSLAAGALPDWSPGRNAGAYWAAGVLSTVLLLASLLAHELAHSIIAKARGFAVEGITLFLIGGVSNIKIEAEQAFDEFVISAVGPATSFVISGALWLALLGVRDGTLLHGVVFYLAFINLLIGAFNLLPAFPLDGGRVLRSIVWAGTGSMARATRVAATWGQIIGALLMIIGAFSVLFDNIIAGLWFGLVGWFINSNAGSSKREAALRENVSGVEVKDVMDPDPATVGPEASISEAVDEYFLRLGVRVLPVHWGDDLLGIITLADIKTIPRDRWNVLRVRDEMTRSPVWHVSPDDDLLHAMAVLGEHGIDQAPVLDRGRLVGLLSRAHIIKYMHARRELGMG